MLQHFLRLILGPVRPPQQVAHEVGKTKPCNVVGGCGAGCLCVPERAAGRARGPTRRAVPPPMPSKRAHTPRAVDYQYWEG